jgi:pyroglutamyl-peptidase
MRTVLITGFEPYGGRGANPSAELARRFDGRQIADAQVVGRALPVSFAGLKERIESLVAELDPVAIISIGLWPGEPVIRLERFAVNLADFEIPDNQGALLQDSPLVGNGPPAQVATLPLRAIEDGLLAAGIPARLSSTAGTFLCNATLYAALDALAGRGRAAPCGFVHVPYLPEQVADLLGAMRRAHALELHQRADLASMDLTTMIRAIEICVTTTLATARPLR